MMYVHMRVYMYVCMRAMCVHEYMCMSECTCMHACMCVCVCACVRAYVSV